MMVPVPRASREANAVMDVGHILVFGAIALMLRWLLLAVGCPRRLCNPIAWVLVTAFGGAIEVAQALVDRHPSWQDLWADALGAAATLLAFSLPEWPAGPARRAGWAGVVILLAAAAVQPLVVLIDSYAQRRQWPVLADFEQPLEITRWEFRGVRAARSATHARRGAEALRLQFNPGKYAAATYIWPLPNWSPYGQLEGELWLDGEEPLRLFVKIEDLNHNGRISDRFERPMLLQPGWNRLKIPLSEVAQSAGGRRLDLGHISRLQLYTAGIPLYRVVYLDWLELTRRPD